MQTSNCDRCYRRKSKCDRLQPCSTCSKAGGIQCTYTDRTKEKTVRPDLVDRLEKRIAQAEGRNKALSAELSRLRSQVASTPGAQSNGDADIPADGPSRPSTNATERRHDLAAEVSFLSTNAAGERQYLGSTSGVLFADLVRASVDMPVSRHVSPPCTEHTADSPDGIETPALGAVRELPPKKLALRLVQAYLDHDFLCYPFLVPSEIRRIVKSLYNPDMGQPTAYELFLIDMLLAISTAQVSKYDWRQLPSAESHHARAMSSIGDVLRLGGLQALHAIILLCQYRTGSSIQDNSGSMWHLVGIAARMCFELGLHKECSYALKGPGADEVTAKRYAFQESKRRSLWCVLSMDRITSLILGRPCAIRDEDFDHVCPDQDQTVSVSSLHQDGNGSKPYVFGHIVRYRLLCGRIASALHRKRSPEITEQHVLRIRQDLSADLELWKQDIAQLRLDSVPHSRTGEQDCSCYLSLEWYDLLFSNAMLMLWRPAPLLSDMSHDAISLQHIFHSAKQSITIYASLHKSRKINYSWITLQSVFLSGLSYIYAVSRHFRSRWRHPSETTLDRDPTTIEVVNDTRACSNVLVAVSERWNAFRNCHEVFDRLSDAVLRDAIKLQTHQLQSLSHLNSAQLGMCAAQSNAVDQHSQGGGSIWPAGNGAMNIQHGIPVFSPLAVDNEFLQCFDDLQHLYDMQQIEPPVMELSQDWLGYLDTGSGFAGPTGHLPLS